MNVSKIKSFFKVNKKSLFYAGLFVFSFFLFSDAAFADPTTGTSTPQETNFIDDAIKGVNFLLIIASGLLGATTSLVSLFLTPGWVNGTIFGLDGYMKEIWILVSNVVYFIFAFLLIVIAFMNIIGRGDKWELKSALPKFIVGVIMVPFTWFFVQFVLSLSAILTVGVLTLPYDSFGGTPSYQKAQTSFTNVISQFKSDPSTEADKKDFPTTFVLNLSENIVDKVDGTQGLKKGKEFFQSGNNQEIDSIISGGNEPDSIFGIIFLYTYGIMQIHDLDVLKEANIANAISSITDLSLKLIFDSLFVLVYMVLMIALFLALLVRGIKLWVYAMLSPTFGLLYFFDKADGVGEGNGKFGIKDFISLALVPVYVAAALSFGLLFIMVANEGLGTSKILGPCNPSDFSQMNVSTTDLTCMKVPGGFTFAIQGSHGNAPSGNAIGKIIMQLFGIVILWMAVMTALKQSEITSKITEPIQQFGGNVGNLIAKSPMYAPIIPGGLSVQGLQRVSTMPKTALENNVERSVGPYRDGINGLFGSQSMSTNDRTNMNNALDGGLTHDDLKNIQNTLKKNAEALGHKNNDVKNYLERFNEGLKDKLGANWEESSKLYDGSGKLTAYGAGILHIDKLESDPDGVATNIKNDFIRNTEVAGSSNTSSDSGGDKEKVKKATFVMSPNADGQSINLSLPKGGSKTILIKDKKMNSAGIDDLSNAISQGLEGSSIDRILVEVDDKQDVINRLGDKLKDNFTISLNDKGKVIIEKDD